MLESDTEDAEVSGGDYVDRVRRADNAASATT